MGYVYKITNTVNGKAYIGISVNEPTQGRIKEHLSGRGNRIIARAVKKYGKEVFTYEILEENVFDEFLPDLEVAYIANFNTVVPNGYNLTSGGEVAKTLSDETRCKISDTLTGEKNPNFGKPMSDEQRKQISESMTGQKRKPHSAKTRRKMSESNKGKTVSAEARRKISEGLKGRIVPAKTRRKMSEAREGQKNPAYGKKPHNFGKPLPEEQRRKISMSKRRPEYVPAQDFFFLLPADMPLQEKRKLLYGKFPNVRRETLQKWVRGWLR